MCEAGLEAALAEQHQVFELAMDFKDFLPKLEFPAYNIGHNQKIVYETQNTSDL